MTSRIERKVVIKLWALRGVVDFYNGFDIQDRFDWYSAFFWHQGLEKLCKAYLLGTKSSEYENRPEQQARKRINEIVRNKKDMGHNLTEMFGKLIEKKVLNEEIKAKVYRYFGKDFTGEDLVEILEKAYMECRYPLIPYPVEMVYFTTEKNSWWNPLSSRELMEFTFEIGLKILNKIEQDFNVVMPRDKTRDEGLIFQFVKDEDWIRFRRILFKESV